MAHKLEGGRDEERQLSDDGNGQSTNDTGRNRGQFSRRRFVELAAASTLSMAGIGTARASSVTRHGIDFDRVVNAVDDLGMDPTGDDPIDDRLARSNDGDLLQFPRGTYRFGAGPNDSSLDEETRGFEGIDDDVTFVASQNSPGYFLQGERMGGVYLGNVDVDRSARNACAGIRLSGSRIVARDVGTVTERDTTPFADSYRDDDDPSGAGRDVLAIEGEGTPTNYEVTVSGDVEAIDRPEEGYGVSGRNVEGVVKSGTSRYAIDGNVTVLRLDGSATASLNGERIDPDRFVTDTSPGGGQILFEATDPSTDYVFSTATRPRTRSGRTDTKSENRRSGTVAHGVERHPFSGRLASLSARGSVTVLFTARSCRRCLEHSPDCRNS